MKQKTLWIIAVVMGLLFTLLLVLQQRYMQEMINLRRQQAEGALRHALARTAFAVDHETRPASYSERLSVHEVDSLLPPLAERITEERVDYYLRKNIAEAGLDLDYHFSVVTTDGRTVLRCSDYDAQGADYFIFEQPLFPKAPNAAQRGVLLVHFPTLHGYIYAAVRYTLPAFLLTFVLLCMFLYVIFLFFRQKRLSQMRTDFVNNMTHELKTPISSVSLAAQMLSDPTVKKSDTMLQHLTGIITEETKRLRFQVDKVLQMSLFEDRRTQMRLELHAPDELVADICTTMQLKAESVGGSIEAQLQADNAQKVLIDEMHFTNVVYNLLDNAIKYRDPERPLRLRVVSTTEHGHYMLRISDNGIGMAPRDTRRAFEKFYRASTGNVHNVKGFGLGLAYVHAVVRAFKGKIKVESQLHEGTTFTIII